MFLFCFRVNVCGFPIHAQNNHPAPQHIITQNALFKQHKKTVEYYNCSMKMLLRTLEIPLKLNALALWFGFWFVLCLCVQFQIVYDAISFDLCISTHLKDENKNISMNIHRERDRKNNKGNHTAFRLNSARNKTTVRI